MVAGEDVGRQVSASDVSQVKRTVGVRPSDPDEDAVSHKRTSLRAFG